MEPSGNQPLHANCGNFNLSHTMLSLYKNIYPSQNFAKLYLCHHLEQQQDTVHSSTGTAAIKRWYY
jgi:hypothetical protein